MKDFFKSPGRLSPFFFCASVLLPFGIYLKTLCPSLYPGDGGELIAAAYTLGIPHPPGYPLYCLLGKLFTFLPFGNVAYRLNLLSAIFAALTVGLVYLILLHLLRKKDRRVLKEHSYIAFIGASFFAFLKDFWFHALIAEVYMLNTFFFALLLYLLLRWIDEKKDKVFLLASFLFGLGLGNHHTLLVFGPLFLCMMLLEHPERLKDGPFLGKAVLFLILGLSVYLYLPLRAGVNLSMNWGMDPSWESFFHHVFRRQYTEIGTMPRTLGLYMEQIHSFFQAWARQGPFYFWIFSLLGFWGLLSKRPKEWFVTTFLFFSMSLLLIMVINFEATSINGYLMRPFYLPVWLVLSLFWGLGLSEFFAFFQRPFPWVKRCFIGCLIFPLFLCLKHFPSNDLSDHHLTENFGRDLLDTVPSGGTLLISGDDTPHFALAYLKIVERLRPDVSIFDLDQSGPFPRISKEGVQSLFNTRGSSIYTNTRNIPQLFLPPRVEPKASGLLYQLVQKGERTAQAPWETYRVKDPATFKTDDPFEKFILARYLWMKGEGFLKEGDPEKAREIFNVIATLADQEGFLHTQLGINYVSLGWPREGKEALQKALRHNPYDSEVWKGLGVALGQLGYYRPSIRLLLRALERRPRDPEITFNLGVSYGNLRQFEKALFWWRRTRLLDPTHPKVDAYLLKAQGFSGEKEGALF